MVADLPGFVIHEKQCDVNSNMMCYADDSSAYASSKCTISLNAELERQANRMLTYCKETGLVINSDKTQMLVSGVKTEEFSVKVGDSVIYPSKELNLLGITYDANFTTAPYLRQLATDAESRAALISQLSYNVPPHLLRMFTNGLLVGKIIASAPAAIPFRIDEDDKGLITLTDQISCALKKAARTITRTRLTDKVRSEVVLQKAGLLSLNEMIASISATMVWKSKNKMDPLGSLLFPSFENNHTARRSQFSGKAKPPVPGCKNLAANLLAKAWNSAPLVRRSHTLGAAKLAARKWA